jgi:hypothetical protein
MPLYSFLHRLSSRPVVRRTKPRFRSTWRFFKSLEQRTLLATFKVVNASEALPQTNESCLDGSDD